MNKSKGFPKKSRKHFQFRHEKRGFANSKMSISDARLNHLFFWCIRIANVLAINLQETHQLSGGTKPEESRTSSANRSSGEGVWGRGASLREAASPPEFPLRISSEGSAREGLL